MKLMTDPLQELQQEKARIRRELDKSRERLGEQAHSLFAPAPQAVGSFQRATNIISQGWTIYEGIRIGLGFIRASRSLFRRR